MNTVFGIPKTLFSVHWSLNFGVHIHYTLFILKAIYFIESYILFSVFTLVVNPRKRKNAIAQYWWQSYDPCPMKVFKERKSCILKEDERTLACLKRKSRPSALLPRSRMPFLRDKTRSLTWKKRTSTCPKRKPERDPHWCYPEMNQGKETPERKCQTSQIRTSRMFWLPTIASRDLQIFPCFRPIKPWTTLLASGSLRE